MDTPVIATERLILRGHQPTDFEALAAVWGDPQVARYIGGKPSTRQESWARLLRYVGHWQVLGFGFWAVELRHESRYVGDVGFAENQLTIDPPIHGIPEGGWVFSPDVHGRGIAAEALRAAQGWIDKNHGGPWTTCVINHDNAASIRLAEKAGYCSTSTSSTRRAVCGRNRPSSPTLPTTRTCRPTRSSSRGRHHAEAGAIMRNSPKLFSMITTSDGCSGSPGTVSSRSATVPYM